MNKYKIKEVRLMFDYCSSSLWDNLGFMLDYDDIRLNKRLEKSIKKWSTEMDILFSTNCIKYDYSKLLYKNNKLISLTRKQYKLARSIKRNLPRTKVKLFNERIFILNHDKAWKEI